jgi:hypothetical protein
MQNCLFRDQNNGMVRAHFINESNIERDQLNKAKSVEKSKNSLISSNQLEAPCLNSKTRFNSKDLRDVECSPLSVKGDISYMLKEMVKQRRSACSVPTPAKHCEKDFSFKNAVKV